MMYHSVGAWGGDEVGVALEEAMRLSRLKAVAMARGLMSRGSYEGQQHVV